MRTFAFNIEDGAHHPRPLEMRVGSPYLGTCRGIGFASGPLSLKEIVWVSRASLLPSDGCL